MKSGSFWNIFTSLWKRGPQFIKNLSVHKPAGTEATWLCVEDFAPHQLPSGMKGISRVRSENISLVSSQKMALLHYHHHPHKPCLKIRNSQQMRKTSGLLALGWKLAKIRSQERNKRRTCFGDKFLSIGRASTFRKSRCGDKRKEDPSFTLFAFSEEYCSGWQENGCDLEAKPSRFGGKRLAIFERCLELYQEEYGSPFRFSGCFELLEEYLQSWDLYYWLEVLWQRHWSWKWRHWSRRSGDGQCWAALSDCWCRKIEVECTRLTKGGKSESQGSGDLISRIMDERMMKSNRNERTIEERNSMRDYFIRMVVGLKKRRSRGQGSIGVFWEIR